VPAETPEGVRPSAWGGSVRLPWPQPLGLVTVAEQGGPRSLPQSDPAPAPPCPALGCRTQSPAPGRGGQPQPTRWAQFFSGFFNNNNKKKTRQISKAPPAPLGQIIGGGSSPGLSPLLGRGEPGPRQLAPSPPPLSPPRFLTTFRRFL